MGQVVPLGAMTDIQGATSSKGAKGGPWGHNLKKLKLQKKFRKPWFKGTKNSKSNKQILTLRRSATSKSSPSLNYWPRSCPWGPDPPQGPPPEWVPTGLPWWSTGETPRRREGSCLPLDGAPCACVDDEELVKSVFFYN